MTRENCKFINHKEHYKHSVGLMEHSELSECEINIKNVGWTMGNVCPFRCPQCYSLSNRARGMSLTKKIINRIVSELANNGVKTVNLGGNEPFFTNGLNRKKTLLPYVIQSLKDKNIIVGLTTSGISAVYLEEDYPKCFRLLNDIDVSIDSPYEDEHNHNRGSNLYKQALKALKLAQNYGINRTIIVCAMDWNFTDDRIKALVDLAKNYKANIRINTIRPVESKHMKLMITKEQFYKGFLLLMELCDQVDIGEPLLAAITNYENAKGCPCGKSSLRIHSITPDGKIPISPCVYLHGYKIGDLIKDKLYNLIRSPQFSAFRRRNAHPEAIKGCKDCRLIKKCRGGCAARAYLYNLHKTNRRSLFLKDPYCSKDAPFKERFPQNPKLEKDVVLVHQDYLCTWIGKPKSKRTL